MSLTSITGYDKTKGGARSIVVIIEGGDGCINAGVNIVGALFVPDGTIEVTAARRSPDRVREEPRQVQRRRRSPRPVLGGEFPSLNDFRVSDYRQVDR